MARLRTYHSAVALLLCTLLGLLALSSAEDETTAAPDSSEDNESAEALDEGSNDVTEAPNADTNSSSILARIKDKWPASTISQKPQSFYDCLYNFFLCSDYVGPWPENRKVCLEYYESCQTNQQKLIEEENKNAIGARYATSCLELQALGHNATGVYRLRLGSELRDVYCDMTDDGGGWLVIQRRGDFGHPQDYFLRNWTSYVQGFGNPQEDFWLGLEALHEATKAGDVQMKITLGDWEGLSVSLIINRFVLGNATTDYSIMYESYDSKIGNSLPPRGTKFSTIDRDNDSWMGNCAERFSGAWWYTACHNSNLNALYLRGKQESYGNGVNWYHWRGFYYSLKFTELKVRTKPAGEQEDDADSVPDPSAQNRKQQQNKKKQS